MSALSPPHGDRVMARLVAARAPLDAAQGEAFLARLVLLLANEIADAEQVMAAIDAAKAAAPAPPAGGG